MNASVSARKIGANLWEVEPQFNFKKLDGDRDNNTHHNYKKEGLLGFDQLQQEPSNSHPVSSHLLDHISDLEEQHSHNTVLIESLKRDLDISRAQIKTLLEERKRDHQEIKELKRSIDETVQSTKDELMEVKSMLKREKKARILLENLCDELAKGIRDYEQKVRFFHMEKDQIDRLVIDVSEAWLDERVQKTSVSDDLWCEIEMFLEAKRKLSDGCEENGSCSQWVSRMIDHGDGVVEASSGRGNRVDVKENTLMAKLLEARLESQFSKSTKVRK